MKPGISAEAGETLDDLMPRSTVVFASFSFLCDYSCKQYEFIIQKLITGECTYRRFKDREGHNELSIWYPHREVKAPGLVAATPYLTIAGELLERANPRLLIIDPVFTGSTGYEGRYKEKYLPKEFWERETVSAGLHFAETAYNKGVPVVVYTCARKPSSALPKTGILTREPSAPRPDVPKGVQEIGEEAQENAEVSNEDWLTLFCTQVLGRRRFIPDNEDLESTVAILSLLNP